MRIKLKEMGMDETLEEVRAVLAKVDGGEG